MSSAKRKINPKKEVYYKRVNELFGRYDRIVVVKCDNVRSQQFHKVRIDLRGKAELVMGKNTLMKKVISDRAQRSDATPRDKQLYQKFVHENLLKENVGIILTSGELGPILNVIETHKVRSAARAGAVAPVDVVVPAINTGLEPGQTNFFMALGIPTKITKGTVEILKDVKVITKGEKVGTSEATLLQKLKIEPFFYGLEVEAVYDKGSVYGLDVLKMTEEDKRAKVSAAVGNVAALSLALGIPCAATISQIAALAFQDVLAVSLATSVSFPEFGAAALKEAIVSGKAAAAAAPAAAPAKGGDKKADAKPAAAPAPKPAEPEPEEEDGGMGGLFD